jgi:hypothetical protein
MKKSLIILTAVLIALVLAGCQNAVAPPQETVLRLKLNDTLSKFDNVVITIVDRQDMSKVLENIWSGPLPAPSQIPGHVLTTAKDRDFVVRIVAYSADGQLFVETLIVYDGGKKSVLHQPVPVYQPRYSLQSLSASAGKLSPNFNKDSTKYQILIPEGVPAVVLNLAAVFPGAQVVVAGEIIKSGSTTKSIAIGTEPDTLSILVTDASQGPSYTREYRVILIPTLPAAVLLASISIFADKVPVVMNPPFDPNVRVYNVIIPSTADSTAVTFVLRPSDPTKMTMIFMGVAIFNGEVSRPIYLKRVDSNVAVMEVYRGSQHTFYQVTINRE